MFYVFGINGPMYQGGADRLSHITAVRSIQRPSGLRAGASGIEGREAQVRQPLQAHTGHAQGALAAYHGTEQGPKEARHKIYTVSDVMTRGSITVTPNISVEQAWLILSNKKIAQAPVLDAQDKVVGLLLRADMAPLALLPEPSAIREAISFAHRTVREVMISPVPTVTEDTSLRQVSHALLETGLPGFPVTNDQGYLSGFISRTDILRAVVSEPPLDLWS